MLGLFGN
ncbi:cad6f46a-eecc-4ec9-ac9c-95ac47ab5a83 [Thermothielavioides terrestris]|nr:cad6f46a-eecc-4ec9-ac9c-95ac47ab5a83 [Thermothielavioides terrestris]